MTMPTVTEMVQELEAVAPDPFIAEIDLGDALGSRPSAGSDEEPEAKLVGGVR